MIKNKAWVVGFLVSVLMISGSSLEAKGKIEFSFHYGSWSVNLLRSVIEGIMSDMVEDQFRTQILEDIQADHPEYEEAGYSQTVGFDSGGDNLGFEARWYPGGQSGSFSFGLGVERVKMRFTLEEIRARLDLQDTTSPDTASMEADINGELALQPLAVLLDFRWDIMPSSRIRPFISFGGGVSTPSAIDNLELSYSYRGELTATGEDPETYEDSATKTGKELKEDMEAEGEEFPLNVVPFLYLGFGIKGVVTDNIHLLVEGAILDGFVLRAGLAIRL
ncbi:MAG: hypothetical protein JW747_03835 [Candidatus Aminicenantes bacterium]|nr:hypothetical protein [Candidatus Aminicenantes bacterium]